MTVADTSVLVAFFDRGDPRHGGVVERLRQTGALLVPTEVLVELLGILKTRAGRAASDEALDALMRLPMVVKVTETDPKGAYQLLQRHKGLSFVDAAAVLCALRKGTPLWTLDVHQGKVFAALGGKADASPP